VHTVALARYAHKIKACDSRVVNLAKTAVRCAMFQVAPLLFQWDVEQAAALVRQEPDGGKVVSAFAAETAGRGALDRDAFRAAAARAKDQTGLKGRALFHPIRVALTAADAGPELDLAVPAIDRGASLSAGAGVSPIVSCAVRAARVAEALAR